MTRAELLLLTLAFAFGCSAPDDGRRVAPDGSPPLGDGAAPAGDGALMSPLDGSTVIVGALDGGVTTGLPSLPPVLNVTAAEIDDGVTVRFEPVAGAVDYRVYPLPKDSDVSVDATGFVTVNQATYRCAGFREAPPANGSWMTVTTSGAVENYARSAGEITIGHGYTSGGAGRVPVYALGSPSTSADNDCADPTLGGQLWGASRVKTYTSDQSLHDTLIAQGWRNDGIAFWAPAPGSAGMVQIYSSKVNNSYLYFADGSEHAARPGAATAFSLLATADSASEPVMRVYYGNKCNSSHDELTIGQGRFDRIAKQGNQSLFEVQWAGLTGPTVLVVEALDSGCPFQGVIGAETRSRFITADALRATLPTGEVFINGQYAAANKPRAIARSYIAVAPAAAPSLDWFSGFHASDPPNPYSQVKIVNYGGQDLYLTSPLFDVQFYSLEPSHYALGPALGELLVGFSDWASDTNGKVRITPKTAGTLGSNNFFHSTMEVDIWATDRRYPQMLVSDRMSPVQDNLPQGNTLIVQTFGGWPTNLQLQLCDHRTWDVNNQCPHYRFDRKPFGSAPWVPHPVVGEHVGTARRARLDLYTSTQRSYLFLDGEAYGCADLPAGKFATGPVTVTFGDVLYHSGVDEDLNQGPYDQYYTFHKQYMSTVTQRHFDNLGFQSGTAAPAWDQTLIPCTSTLDP